MDGSPYVRETLTATRVGIPDPRVEVECWLDRLADLLTGSADTPDRAYDTLALWARVRRSRPELIQETGEAAVFESANSRIVEQGALMADLAMELPNPAGWLEQARELADEFEAVGPAAARSELAEQLIIDLDDAQLAIYAMARCGAANRDVSDRVSRCEDWLSEHADYFLAASVYVQAMGMSIRPDLDDFDYDLAVTAVKYQDLLWAAEQAESSLAVGASPMNSTAVEDLAVRFEEASRTAVRLRRRFVTQQLPLLIEEQSQMPVAAAAEAGDLPSLLWWEWTSPGSGGKARITVPPQLYEEDRLVVQFLNPDGSTDASRQDECVRLHGGAAAIDSEGRAAFSPSEFLVDKEPLVLRVGSDDAEWELTAGSEPV